MLRLLGLSALCAAAAGLFCADVWASGSIGPGAGKISPRAAYSQGKKLTFDALVCGGCPLRMNELNAARARSLTASLETAHGGGDTDDPAVQALCGAKVDDCEVRMEVVHYYLTRRFKLKQ